MADLSILDKLRFVASQQNQKKRNASSLLSLSQDSTASTQPVTTQLTRQMSDTTTHSQTIAFPVKPRQAKRVPVMVHIPGFELGSDATPPRPTYSVECQTNPFASDVPPLPADWSVFTAILERIDSIRNTIQEPKISETIETSLVLSQRSDALGLEDLLDSPDLSPQPLLSGPAWKSDVSISVPDILEEPQSSLAFIPTYEATLKLSDIIESVPRPRPPPPKKAKVVEPDPLPRRSPRIEEMTAITQTQPCLDIQVPLPLTQTTSLLKRIKKAVQSSII